MEPVSLARSPDYIAADCVNYNCSTKDKGGVGVNPRLHRSVL